MTDPSDPTSPTAVPPLGEALRFVRMSGIFYCPSHLSEPWGLSMPPMANTLWFHMVISGRLHLVVDGEDEVRVAETGDLVVVPHGHGHRAWGAEPAPTPSVLDLPHEELGEQYAVLRHGGGGPMTDIVCGGVRFDHPAAAHLIDALPPVIHLRGERTTRDDWIRITLDLMAEETRRVQPGGEAVVSRLCDILVIQAVRTWIERDPAARTGWLGALRDPQVGAAIAAVHRDPGRDWTVESLSAVAAMSRSAFAARFTELAGEPAMRYVTRWRMHHALDLLRAGRSVATVAREVGYDSEAAFSRAFKRLMGDAPRTAARRVDEPPGPIVPEPMTAPAPA